MKLFGAKIMIYDSKQSILAGIDIYIFFERLYRVCFFFKIDFVKFENNVCDEYYK